MGSVNGPIDCPNCGEEANEDYYYKSDEVYIFCSKCGYYYNRTLKIDDDNEIVMDDDGYVYDERSNDHPFGIFKINPINGFGMVGTIEDEDHYKRIKRSINSHKVKSIDIQRYIDGEFKKETIVPKPPKIVVSDVDPYGEEDWGDDD